MLTMEGLNTSDIMIFLESAFCYFYYILLMINSNFLMYSILIFCLPWCFLCLFRCLEQAALISKELGDLDSIYTLCQRAASMYREHGIPDTAALSLERGAKIIENQLPEKALDMFEHAVDIVMVRRPHLYCEINLCHLIYTTWTCTITLTK